MHIVECMLADAKALSTYHNVTSHAARRALQALR